MTKEDSRQLFERLKGLVDEERLEELLSAAVEDVQAGRGRAQLEPDCLANVREAYERYSQVVTESRLAQNTKNTYLLHSGNFVKWLAGEFFPGERLKG